jgi:peptidoglycan/LPS O-acetylase OafA/YrhL
MAGAADKNSQIEVLRAVAVVYTLFHHLPIVLGPLPKYWGWLYRNADFSTGVDLFFVISGFVITRSLCNSVADFQASRWRLMVAFWLKRVFRLLPLAWLWLLITALYILALEGLLGAKDQHGSMLIPVLASWLQVANLYSAYCMAHMGKGMACEVTNLTAHYWSLSLEEQFYLMFPFLFFLVNRKILVIALCIAVVAQLFWLRPIISFAWYFRTDGLAWGVLLGFFTNTSAYASSARWLSHWRHSLLATMLLLIVLLPMIASQVGGVFGYGAKSYGTGAIAFVSACIVLIASYDFTCFGKTGALHKVMLYLGARSYSLYVTHFILFNMIGYAASLILAGKDLGFGLSIVFYISLALLSLLATFAASELSYRYVESRYRPKGRQYARQLLTGFVSPQL